MRLGGCCLSGTLEGSPSPNDGEISEIAWFEPEDLPGLRLSNFTRALLRTTGHLG